MASKTISVKLKVWRQASQASSGRLVDYAANNISTDMSFLEMLDVVNEDLIRKGEDAIAFDSDCREGICGACGLMINGVAHGPDAGATTCQLHMRRFTDGDTITVEPWRAKAFPVLKDLAVDRRAFDRILAAGGYATVNTLGGAFTFSSPTGVAVDGSGNVFVADYSNNAVEEILAAGGYITVNTLGGGFSAPQDVAVDGRGNVSTSPIPEIMR